MDGFTSFASIPAIIAICYFTSEAYIWFMSGKDGKIHDKKAHSFVPILCGSLGMILGILTYYQNPEVIHSDSVISAAATGMTSGLASETLRNRNKR